MVDTPDVSSSKNHNKLGCPPNFLILIYLNDFGPHSYCVALKFRYFEKPSNILSNFGVRYAHGLEFGKKQTRKFIIPQVLY